MKGKAGDGGASRDVAHGRHALALALLVLVACLVATYAFWHELRADSLRMRTDAFEYRAQDAVGRIDTRLRRYAQLLRGAAALAVASHELDREEFETYTNALQLDERYPEIHAFGIAVADDAAPDRAPALYVRRSMGESAVQAGEDLRSEPSLAEAMKRATATSAAALSGAIRPQAGTADERPHFLVFVPFSGHPRIPGAANGTGRVSGWLFAEVSAYGMMHRLFGETLGDNRSDVDIRVRDRASPQGAPLLYGVADAPAQEREAANGLVANHALAFGGREWIVEVRAMPGFAESSGHDHAALLAAASGGSSLLLAVLTWLLATGRARARAEAERMNRDLIASESRLRDLNEDLERRVARRTRELESFAERLSLAVATSNTGLWDWNLATDQVHYSKEWARQLGVEQEELRADIEEWKRRLHPEDRERALAHLQDLQASSAGPCETELRMRHSDGTFRTMLCRARSYADASGRPVRIIGSHLDITERKRAEEGLVRLASDLRQTWRQLSQVEETERRWLASELHDSVGSALTALNLNLTIVRERLPEEARAALHPRLTDSIALLEQTVETVRDLMAQLRPPVLDDYGLATALRWYVEQIAGRASLRASFRLTGEDVRLSAESEIALFRIAQGALANVMKHSGAQHAEVCMDVAAASLHLTIVDDGRGFVPEKTHADLGSPHWGLVTMRERAQSIGGRCTIESTPGRGTRVTVEAPLRK